MPTARERDTRPVGRRHSTDSEYEHLLPLFARMARLDSNDPRRARLREALVTGYRPLAEHVAARYRHRGMPAEDLVQVATVGLIKAIDRFEPDRGVDFLCFAVPTILGEVRRHFRDTGWSIRVSRKLQELHLELNAATTDLAQRLGCAPTPSQLAHHLGLDVEWVRAGLLAGSSYHAVSLDTPLVPDEPSIGETLGEDDSALETIDYLESVRPMIEQLPERERTVLILRFFRDMSQTEIARRVGISQMQVSRLLRDTLASLRAQLFDSRP
jgi:RNA polymerase sigma-B factor